MGYEPIIDSSGSWKIGSSASLPTTINRPWRDALTPTFTLTGSMTCSNSGYTKIINNAVLTAEQMYLIEIEFGASANPWILSTSFLYSCVEQNGSDIGSQSPPMLIHADNGTAIYFNVRPGTSSGRQNSGLEIQIYGVDGRVGTYTCKVYSWGNL